MEWVPRAQTIQAASRTRLQARWYQAATEVTQGMALGCSADVTAENKKTPDESRNAIFANSASRCWKKPRLSSVGGPPAVAKIAAGRRPARSLVITSSSESYDAESPAHRPLS